MKWSLKKIGFDKKNIISYGNMFLIGNGHLGYRGTLEEFKSKHLVGSNVVGFYDKFQDKWRESLNAPNAFYVEIKNHTVFNSPINHEQKLNLKNAIVSRKTEFSDLIIQSEKFISSCTDNLLMMKYSIHFKKDETIKIKIGTDLNIYEINGPHFIKKKIYRKEQYLYFEGLTNEGKVLRTKSCYIFPKNIHFTYKNGFFHLILEGKKDKNIELYVSQHIYENCDFSNFSFSKKEYVLAKKDHIDSFSNKWNYANVSIVGDNKADFLLRYSIYHLLILGNKNYCTSIPARGVSGQTYKGAIFWDTEIFLEPFYNMVDPEISRNLILYRINTLEGAKKKAQEFGYEGAFYAWESQDTGLEACSKYNVTDPLTNKPIRTYFNEKQIHISADIVYSIEQYIKMTDDISILFSGALDVMKEVAKFFISYKNEIDGVYHLNDVIGPDEYHERVNDNAFTNYMAYYACKITLKYLLKFEKNSPLIKEIEDFTNKLYLPQPNDQKIIEQFSNYFNLEDTSVEIVRSRLKFKNEYWGTENGVAYPTRVIKQADVVALISLFRDYFSFDIKKANYDFYYPYTEHGSSLSSSMYGILGFTIKEYKTAYEMFLKSSSIDLGTDQKMFAGGIYIGGTHPASNGGAYMVLIYGILGMSFKNDDISINLNIPKKIRKISLKFKYKNKSYYLEAYQNKQYKLEEII